VRLAEPLAAAPLPSALGAAVATVPSLVLVALAALLLGLDDLPGVGAVRRRFGGLIRGR